ncbi:ADP-ribose pyrophosphatase [Lentzea xinjiangensis]|uniref:ADP-ribose pyrophosphatase n=1 Tax=Lentzea xinjiangensis TaxID=402600 RepID=A0A1H9NWB6_9PSEU|nr:NUDIX hydrolase [Lentzea xinjiangensis]SER39965.1 ADP-ribose pyrophosphatase [Lentzea xinjiangensis]
MTSSGAARHDFRTVSSEDVHVGKILALRVDEVEMPGGGTAKREIVEHTGAVAVVAVDEQGRVTLVHQYRHALGRHLWELPAGLLDHEGEPPVVGARRELAEEVGLAAEHWHVLVDVAASPGFTDEVVRVFLARELSEVDRDVQGEEEADLEVHRFDIAEAVRMVLSGEIVNASSVAGLLAAREVIEGRVEPRPADAPFRDKPTRFIARKK